MGYDPVFKNDRPASIQPAPTSSAPPSKPSLVLSTLPSNSYPSYQGALNGGTYIPQLAQPTASLDGTISYHAVDSVVAEHDSKMLPVANNNHFAPAIQSARRCMYSVGMRINLPRLTNNRSCQPYHRRALRSQRHTTAITDSQCARDRKSVV